MKRFAAPALLIVSVAARAGGDISVDKPWMRPTAVANAAIYLTLRNAGAEPADLNIELFRESPTLRNSPAQS